MFREKDSSLFGKEYFYNKKNGDDTPKIAEDFLKSKGINYKGLFKNSHRRIVFHETFFYKYVYGSMYKNGNIARIDSYLFYRDGTLLYSAHNIIKRNYYPSPLKDFKLHKRAYDLHHELDSKYLREIGKQVDHPERFHTKVLDLLEKDKPSNAVQFIKEA